MRTARLFAGFAALVAVTEGLIVLGALVRAHEAGLACPDWPLCFGQLIPRMDLKIAFEWSHRGVAGSVALGFSALAFFTLRDPETTRGTRTLVVVGFALLALQIVLGALTVWQLLAVWTVTSHLVAGNAFAVIVFFLALALHERRAPPRRLPVSTVVRLGVWIAAALLTLQLAVGGLVSSSFAGLACPEWPTCNGGIWLPSFQGSVGLHLLHRYNGYLLAGCLVAVAVIARGQGRVGTLALAACAIGGLQVVVGIANVVLALPVEVTGLHSGLAALLVLIVAAGVRELRLSPAA